MVRACEQVRPTLRAVLREDFERITPEEVAQLDAHLHDCETCSASLAAQRSVGETGGDPVILAARRSAVRLAPAASEAVWRRIRGAAAGGAQAQLYRRLRRLAPLAVAAACVLMVNLWTNIRGVPAHPWVFEAAAWVEVDGVEVFDDHSGIFVSSGGNGALPFIWVIDESGEDS